MTSAAPSLHQLLEMNVSGMLLFSGQKPRQTQMISVIITFFYTAQAELCWETEPCGVF